MRVELVYFSGCPNVALMREILHRCLPQCGFDGTIFEVNTDEPSTPSEYRRFASPSVLVDGTDVLAGALSEASACRLRMPTDAELIAAIRGHHEDRR